VGRVVTERDTGATAGGHLAEAAREGGRAVTQAAGRVAEVVSSAVRGGDGNGAAPAGAAADAGAGAVSGAARGGLELAQRTAGAAGEAQREVARRSAEGAADLGRLYAELLDEQFRHTQRVATALGRAVNVDWDEVVRAQGELMHASLERMGRLNDRYLELVRAVMTAASTVRR
jgi:hypothetical protein